MPRPRLLLLSQTLPHPPDSGVKSRSASLFRQLARAFDITALCFYRRDSLPPAGATDAVQGLADVGRVEAFPIPQEHSRIRWVRDHLSSLVSGRVYTVAAYWSRAFGRRLGGLLQAERFDLVHADSLDLSVWFDRVGNLPLVCGHHDVQSLLLARRAEREEANLERRYLALQARRMAKEERRWGERVALNTCVSDVDRTRLQAIAPRGKFMVVPNGVDLGRYRPAQPGDDGAIFVGSAGWLPNRDAMRHFAEVILPELQRLRPGVVVRWVGRVSEQDRKEFEGRHGMELTGHVPDPRPWIARAGCAVAPLRVGSGTRVKILEAWAMGKAVVSTTIGAEGLAARDGENILLRDEPAGFAAAVDAILGDPALRARLGAAGRRTVETDYDWDKIGSTMNTAYLGLLH